MNQSAINYANISAAQGGGFSGSKKNITKDIARNISYSNHHQSTPIHSTFMSCAPKNNQTDDNSQAEGSEDTSLPKPSLLKHYKSSHNDTGVKYKVGNTN